MKVSLYLLATLLTLWAPAALARSTAAPSIDLVNNHTLIHLFNRGLLIPLASEGFYKYCIEYRSPWGEVRELQGRPGRPLHKPVASLSFALFEEPGAAVLRLRVMGLAQKQRLSVRLNGKPVGGAQLSGRSWQVLDLPVNAGILKRGENELQLRLYRVARLNRTKVYGLFNSLELIPGRSAGDPDWPDLSPVRKTMRALGGYRSLVTLLELPREGTLQLRTRIRGAGRPRLKILAAPALGGKTVSLLDLQAKAGPTLDHRLDLGKLAGQLVLLQMTVEGDASQVDWIEPRVLLPQRQLTPASPPKLRNAIIFIGDALRSDRLSLYNSKSKVRMPHLETAARKGGVVLLHNQAASPSSPPSHTSIQTGMIPRVHGVAGDKSEIGATIPTISELLGRIGIRAAYYGNNPFGMERLRGAKRWHTFMQPVKQGHSSDCSVLVKLMLSYAQRQARIGKRFFISALAYEPHVPYRFHQGITERYFEGPFVEPIGKEASGHLLNRIAGGRVKMNKQRWAQLQALYNGEVEYMDRCFGNLLDGLKQLNQLQHTAIVLTGDHGEGFNEHGKVGHAFGLQAELVNVPLVLLVPGLAKGLVKIETVSSHLDIVPTLLHLLGVKGDPRIQGRSLVPIIQRAGSWPPRVVPIEYGRSYALRSRHFKYWVGYTGDEHLFHVAADPFEQKDITSKHPLVLRYFRDLSGLNLIFRSRWRMESWGTLNRHAKGFLRHIGAR